MNKSISLNFQYTKEDRQKFLGEMSSPNPLILVHTKKLLLILIGYLIFDLATSGYTGRITFLIVLVVVLLLAFIPRGKFLKSMLPHQPPDNKCSLVFSEEGVHMIKGKIDIQLPWRDCSSVQSDEHGYTMLGKRPIFIPKRLFESKQQELEFLYMLKRNLGSGKIKKLG